MARRIEMWPEIPMTPDLEYGGDDAAVYHEHIDKLEQERDALRDRVKELERQLSPIDWPSQYRGTCGHEWDVNIDGNECPRCALEAQKDGAYTERNKCVALIARLALDRGWKAGLGQHVGEEWDDDWRRIVFIELPTGQVSWHIHDSEVGLFDFLPKYGGQWDGHDTPTKYDRVMGVTRPSITIRD